MRLSALTAVNQFVQEDNDARELMGKFLAAYDKDKIDQLIRKYGCAERAYTSEELHDLRFTGRHYERLGALVRLHYVNFDLIYEIIPFPDTLWNETEGFGKAAQNGQWTADGKGLPDFWKNFAYLQRRYEQKRKEEAGQLASH